MMYCTGCGQQKDDAEFWSARYSRHVARCASCRAEFKVVEDALKTQQVTRTPETIAADRRRKEVATVIRKEPTSNIRLIPDAMIARDLAWLFDNNPQLGKLSGWS